MNPVKFTVRLAAAAGVVTVSLTLAGCLPPFIEALDRAAPLTRQMTTLGSVGPVSFGSNASAMKFFPAKPTASSIGSAAVTAGFAVAETPGQEQLSFISAGSTGTGGAVALPLAGAAANYPLYEYAVTATLTNQASILVFKFDPSVTSSSLQQYVATLPSGSMTSLAGPLTLVATTLFAPAQTVVGTCDLAPAAGTQDTFAFLGQNAGVLSVATAQLLGTAAAFPIGTAMPPGTATIPGTVTRYAYDLAAAASYTAVYNGSQWNVQRWVGAAAATAMSGITHRIDGILTTGDLVSTEGGVLRLYNPSGAGSELYAIPLNGLQYCYEAYVGSTPYVFFSLSMQLPHGWWGFSVYAVPTSSMRSLGG
jgi:hypothetical protein